MVRRAARIRMLVHKIELWIEHKEIFREQTGVSDETAAKPVTLVLRFRKSASCPTLPFAINARVFVFARSDADPVTVVPLIAPEPRLSPLNISSNSVAFPPFLVKLNALRNPFLSISSLFNGIAPQRCVPLVPT